jgi:uncharacterized protein YggE
MRFSRLFVTGAAIGAALVFTPALPVVAPLMAQDGQATAKAPQLHASATGEVELRPDRATITLTVESRGSTAAKAASETARRQKQVLDALRALGIPAEQMQTASLQINPEYVNPGPGQRPKVSGYVASSSLRVQITNIEQVGPAIDAALSGEATGVGGLSFWSSKEAEARKQALALAVAKAMGEVDAMARAAGGTLGGLIELSADQPMPKFENRGYAMAMASARSDAMPVAEGTIKVTATVNGRWAFTPR